MIMNELSHSTSAAENLSASVSSFSTAKLLQTWERGQRQLHIEKALTLLAAAHPDSAREALATLSIGQRDAGLISLREQLFGSHLSSLTDCPACGERLELNFNVNDIRVSTSPTDYTVSLHEAGYELQLRLPNSLDLLRLTDCVSRDDMRSRLFEQCIIHVTHKAPAESTTQPDEMPEQIVELAIERLGKADPQADVEIALNCPECGHKWHTAFDIVSYLWSELQAWVMQLFREVHLLASAYGWHESDILNMTAQRRQCYLELLSQ
jgi:uncharacterized protein (UPF0212 family)